MSLSCLKHFNGLHCSWPTGLHKNPLDPSPKGTMFLPIFWPPRRPHFTQMTPSHPSFRSQLLSPSLNKPFPTNQEWLKSFSFWFL